MASERTLINLRGYCLYCLKKIINDGDNNNYQSPASTPVPPSPLSTPLRTRCHNVHSLAPEERLAPFTDLCRYMDVELPDSDCYAFGDGSEPGVLYPPLCEKCHELSARLCVLQDELQYIQTRIHNTVERIHRRVATTCDQRGAIKREEFNKDFRRKSKGSLSRGRGENSEMKKVTELLKVFQMKVIEKAHENRESKRRRTMNVCVQDYRNSIPPMHLSFIENNDNREMENEENRQPEPESVTEEQLSLSTRPQEDNFQEYLPLEETLRCSRPDNDKHGIVQNIEVENVQVNVDAHKPYPEISTICCSYQSLESRSPDKNQEKEASNDDFEDYHLKTTLVIGVTTRSQAREQLNTINKQNKPLEDQQHRENPLNDSVFIRRRTKKRQRKD